MLLTIIILTPIIAAMLSLMVKRRVWLLEVYASVAALIECGIAFVLAVKVGESGSYVASHYFSNNALDTLFTVVVTIISLIITWYSIGYLRKEKEKNIIGFRRVRQYFVLLNAFIFAMLLALSTTSPTIMWIAIEVTTLITALLITFYNKPSALEAGWKYLIINSVGLLFAFLGTIIFLAAASGTDGGFIAWSELMTYAGRLHPVVLKIGFVLVFVGYGTKVGLVPMHTWRPDAYSKAPMPIVALLSGALMNVAFLAIIRFKSITDSVIGVDFSSHVLMFFGLLSIIVAGFTIFAQENYKRLLAWSSVEHAGVIALGFGFGGRIGVFAALLHMLYHSLAKSLLFCSAGNFFLKYGSTKLKEISGSLKSIPLSSVLFLIGFLAATGVPPFGIFRSELYVMLAGIGEHPILIGVMTAGLALTFLGFLKQVSAMLFGNTPQHIEAGEASLWTTIPPVLLLVVFIILGFSLPGFVEKLLVSATLLIVQ